MWQKSLDKGPVYDENDTADVAVYLAADPEESGITYSLVTGDRNGADPLY